MNPDLAAQDQLDDILHPHTAAKSFRITVVFGKCIHTNYGTAVALAKRNPTYKEEGTGDWVRHSAVYTPETVEDLFALFNLVHDWEGTEILVNHKRLPYGHQLWLPLMWFHRIK
jgi:hypothetical protein